MSSTAQTHRPTFGLIGFILGLIALTLVAIQVSAIMDPPKQSAATSIGEIAAEIRDSAKRAISGEEAPAAAPQNDFSITQIMTVVGSVLGGLAAILGAVSLFRQEQRTLGLFAIGFGTGAIIMQYVFWLAVIICGALLLISIISNLDGILGG